MIWANMGHAAGKIHWRNTYEQLKLVGPKSMGVALLTAGFVGMVFTIQVGSDLGPPHLDCCRAACTARSRTSGHPYRPCSGAPYGL